jgi:SAM-dependent methyltransferase
MTEALPLPDIHIAIMQPPGYVHSLCFLDPARYLRYQLRRFGVSVTMSKNRLRSDALNLVLGAHLGFPVEWKEHHACLFMNLEQLGNDGAPISGDYIHLLSSSGVVDYSRDNVRNYGQDIQDVPLIPFWHAPYLEPSEAAFIPLHEREIDLLFFGSMNERRLNLIRRIEACGRKVTTFSQPLYAEERDRYVRNAKAVLNFHFYEKATFEQVRAFHTLSLGTPLISELSAQTKADEVFRDAVNWFSDESLEDFFTHDFGTQAYLEESGAKYAKWITHDPLDQYAELMAFCSGYSRGHALNRRCQVWRPKRINLGSGKDYKPSWLNLDVVAQAAPDLILDLGKPQRFPLRVSSEFGLEVLLEEGTIEAVYANNVLEHVPDLPCLMTNLLGLLKVGGDVEIEVPYEKALTAWQDPTHLRAMNENSWIYYTEWFWYLGWFEYRFELVESFWLDSTLRPCEKASACFMKVKLRKIETSESDRTMARTAQSDLRLPED